ncbi:hypothetical protein D9758_012493 [Tetrapyrgos nigripes]|uniref:Uncharacterized protein n=1 Tax=Tetrapyrgos nigripes TaxID=182062 RepID=A0A8H5LHE1_9AGAR|nr:hypothetical protein D9758_012493 [Tetrapyrgos nigripes]
MFSIYFYASGVVSGVIQPSEYDYNTPCARKSHPGPVPPATSSLSPLHNFHHRPSNSITTLVKTLRLRVLAISLSSPPPPH